MDIYRFEKDSYKLISSKPSSAGRVDRQTNAWTYKWTD